MGDVDLRVDELCPEDWPDGSIAVGWTRLCGWVAGCVAILALLASFVLPGSARAEDEPPEIVDSWVTDVTTTSARLRADIDPMRWTTTYYFSYITDAAYEENLSEAKDGFAGAQKAPVAGNGVVPEEQPFFVPGQPRYTYEPVMRHIGNLAADTTYRYRVFASNALGETTGPERFFRTFAPATEQLLADNRGWEIVSPLDKDGGEVQGFGANAGGGVLQASADGASITFSTDSPFGTGLQGAPIASQYLSRRGSDGWSTQNITIPALSGGYGTDPLGVPYQLFATDLSSGIVLNGRQCRNGSGGCGVPSSPLPGTGAPTGYQNYYLRDNGVGTFEAVLTSANADLSVTPEEFSLGFAGSSPDLSHVLLSTCAALTANAIEVPGGGGGCDGASPNLYRWSAGSLHLVNIPPAQSQGDPGAVLAAQSGAISEDGSRVFWIDLDTDNLYVRDGGVTEQVDADVGGDGVFQTASADGSVALFTKNGHLYRFDLEGGVTTDLTPGGAVEGVLGASEDGSHVYYLTSTGLFLRHNGTTTKVAEGADPSNHPPTTGTSRISPDGRNLAFLSGASLTGRDNLDIDTGLPVSEVFLYDAVEDTLRCVSCNPSNGRPLGPSWIPGARANGIAPGATESYKSRALSADGKRLFFETRDALVLRDSNSDVDVYEWEAEGAGTCQEAGGCISLISSGRAARAATFVDADEDGSDVFFLTDRSLIPGDLAAVDLYDARVGGGFPVPPSPIPCAGDACQSLPPEPEDPPIGSLNEGQGNPPIPAAKKKQSKKKKKKKRNKRRARRGGRR